MAEKKLPPAQEVFEFWLSLGDDRSLSAVADHFGVHRSQITRLAKKQGWLQMLERDIEPQVARRVEGRIIESLAEMRLRQASVGRELVEKGLEVLRRIQCLEARDAIAAVKLGAELEARAHEQPNKRISVEHSLRERLISATPVVPQVEGPKPRLTVEFGELEDGMAPEDVARAEEADDGE